MSRLLFAAIVIGAFLPATARAAKVKVWTQNTSAGYEKAELKQAVVSSDGVVRLARQLKPLAGLDAAHVWDVVEDKDANLFVATSNEGKIFKVTPDGKVSVVYTSDESQVLCLTLAADGSIYAGTGPSGKIVRIDAQGEAKVFCETTEQYVWSLAYDSKTETLYAGTGPKGKIYKITRDGKAGVFYSTKQEHILCIALGAESTVYAGTDKGGLVYRIDAKGKGFVLYQAPQSEIRALKVTADGIYVGTSSPTNRRAASSSSGSGSRSAVASLGSDTPASAEVKRPAS